MSTIICSDRFNLGNGAEFSKCEKYRYALWRLNVEDTGKNRCVFIMLNPSTADHKTDDPSVAKCRKYAELWGYKNVYVVNLFAWRATDPEAMKKVLEPIGKENDRLILETCRDAGRVVAAWSNHATHFNRSDQVRRLLRDAGIKVHALKVNVTGEPAHPLYLSLSLKPKVFEL